ncbi:MAG: hypothetical protein GF405_01670 [Candidatus Eisenbacteria bacterium]|nr:hypothetical protein [Candidatus Eisenbacteria bacterium]
MKHDIRTLVLVVALFLVFYFVPFEAGPVRNAISEALALVQWYAREHMLFGLLPAFFLAGAISAFISKSAVMRYLGARAHRGVAYAVASVSGSVLAVCSCTILPLFASIYSRGAGLGPATTFLYSGPAINVLAIILTARVLGPRIGVARAVGAVGFSIVIGLLMHLFFRKGEAARAEETMQLPEPESERPAWKSLVTFATMVAILAFANWGHATSESGFWHVVYSIKWPLAGGAAVLLAALLVMWFGVKTWLAGLVGGIVLILSLVAPGRPLVPFLAGVAGLILIAGTGTSETRRWMDGSWQFAKQILPLLLVGIVIVGALLGRPGHDGLIPARWINMLVGGNSIRSNVIAALAGGLMYFCTLTEVPVVQGLMGAGMGEGPALAFLLAGPAVSIPNVLIMHSVVGTKKTAVYLALVVTLATGTGVVFGLAGG